MMFHQAKALQSNTTTKILEIYQFSILCNLGNERNIVEKIKK